jgi:predicted SnoaL-like aldol condensation-catalyzing enzyme
MKELLEANNWDRAHLYLTKRYIQHNPNAADGLDAVVNYFTKVVGAKPKPIPAKLSTPVVSVVAEGDLVVVSIVREHKDSKGNTYTTTWFDQWRFVDGKADEHWDGATRP